MVEHENTVFQELVRWGSSLSDMPPSAHCPAHSLPNNIIKIKARPNQQSVDTWFSFLIKLKVSHTFLAMSMRMQCSRYNVKVISLSHFQMQYQWTFMSQTKRWGPKHLWILLSYFSIRARDQEHMWPEWGSSSGYTRPGTARGRLVHHEVDW